MNRLATSKHCQTHWHHRLSLVHGIPLTHLQLTSDLEQSELQAQWVAISSVEPLEPDAGIGRSARLHGHVLPQHLLNFTFIESRFPEDLRTVLAEPRRLASDARRRS